MERENEIWRDVIGYEGLYLVSNLGRVKSLRKYRHDKNGVTYRLGERIMSQTIDAYGYPVVGLTDKGGVHRAKGVHRLMAMAFIPNPENKRCVDHINGIRNDNRLENLRWATHSENTRNMFALNQQVEWADRNLTDEQRQSFTKSQSRPVIRSDGQRFESLIAAARALGKEESSSISRCVRGLAKKAYGYSFRYANEGE